MTSILQHIDWLNGRVPDAVRAHLRQLVEVVGFLPHQQPLAVLTADAVLLAANRPFLDLLGASGDEQLGADWDDFMPGWSVRTRCGGGAGDPRTLAFEDYLLPGAGDPVWVRVVACPVFAPEEDDADGEALAAWALFVLDQRPGAREGDERRRGAILDLLLESPSEFVVQLGPEGTVEYLSPSLRRALGVFADGAEGKPLAAIHALAGDKFAERFRRLLDELLKPPFRSEFEMAMTSSEEEHIIQWRFESLLADGGDVRGILGVGRDVTERRRAEDERAQSELRLRTLVEATNQLIWTTGPGGVVDRPMESWSAFTGQDDDEVLGDGWTEAVHPDDRERVLETWLAALAARGVYACEYRLRTVGRRVPLDRGARRAAARRGRRAAVLRRGTRHHQAQGGRGRRAPPRRAGEHRRRGLDPAGERDAGHGGPGRRLRARRDGPLPRRRSREPLPAGAGRHPRSSGVRLWRREHRPAGGRDTSQSVERLGWLRERAAAGLPVVVHAVDELPPEAEAEREVLVQMGLEAVLAVPVLQEPTLVGLLCYEIEAGAGDGADRRWDEDDVSLVRLVSDQLASILVWRADELNLRSVADSFLAFGPDVAENLAHVCRAAGTVTGADVVLYTRRRGRDLVTEAGWNVPDGLPRGTPAEGRLDADVMARCSDEQVHIERDLQDTLYAHTSPIINAHGRAHLRRLPGDRRRAGRSGRSAACSRGTSRCARASWSCCACSDAPPPSRKSGRRAIEDRVLGLAQLEQAMERTVGTLSGAVEHARSLHRRPREARQRAGGGHRQEARPGQRRPPAPAPGGDGPRPRQDHGAGGDPQQADAPAARRSSRSSSGTARPAGSSWSRPACPPRSPTRCSSTTSASTAAATLPASRTGTSASSRASSPWPTWSRRCRRTGRTGRPSASSRPSRRSSRAAACASTRASPTRA